jgi:hypothetical protein
MPSQWVYLASFGRPHAVQMPGHYRPHSRIVPLQLFKELIRLEEREVSGTKVEA